MDVSQLLRNSHTCSWVAAPDRKWKCGCPVGEVCLGTQNLSTKSVCFTFATGHSGLYACPGVGVAVRHLCSNSSTCGTQTEPEWRELAFLRMDCSEACGSQEEWQKHPLHQQPRPFPHTCFQESRASCVMELWRRGGRRGWDREEGQTHRKMESNGVMCTNCLGLFVAVSEFKEKFRSNRGGFLYTWELKKQIQTIMSAEILEFYPSTYLTFIYLSCENTGRQDAEHRGRKGVQVSVTHRWKVRSSGSVTALCSHGCFLSNSYVRFGFQGSWRIINHKT